MFNLVNDLTTENNFVNSRARTQHGTGKSKFFLEAAKTGQTRSFMYSHLEALETGIYGFTASAAPA